MKRLLPVILLASFCYQLSAQLTANAGSDKNICPNTYTNIGGAPTASGGTPPYTYVWSPSIGIGNPTAANPFVNIVVPTTFTVTVTDNLGQTAVDSVVVSILPGLSLGISIQQPYCGIPNPMNFTSQVVSGGPPIAYQWDFGDGSSSTIPNTPHNFFNPGVYAVTLWAQDSSGCSDTVVQFVQVSVGVVVTGQVTDVTCNGASDGTIDLTITNGNPPYSYLWSNGMTTEDALGMPAGTYSITVVDAVGCLTNSSFTIFEPTALVATITASDESAQGACDGQATVVATGGVTPYAYNWSPFGPNTATISNLCSGVYTVTVTDANGCSSGGLSTVGSNCSNNTLSLSVTSQDLSCTHTSDTMVVNITGGTPPYTSYWNTGVAGISQIVNVGGVYVAYVVDSNGCSKSIADTLDNLGVIVSLNGINPVTCNGVNDGKIKVNVTGGTPPYTYLWSNNSTADSLTNVNSGFYTLTVTDATLCSAQAGYNLPQSSTNWSYYLYTNTTPANCANTGTAGVAVYGGTPPFSFLWSNGDTTQNITALAPGNYNVTVSGADGCVRNGYVNVVTACYNVIQGYLYKDNNGNCIKDNGELSAGAITITATNGTNSFYGYANSTTGFYSVNCAASGTFTLSAYSYNSGCSNVIVCNIPAVTFGSLGDTVNANIGFGSSGAYDLAIHPGWTSANPGFTKDYWVLYNQEGAQTYSGPAVITFTYDTILQYQSSTQGGVHNAANHTVTWNLANVPANWVAWSVRPMAYFTVPANTPIGYQLRQDFRITPATNDCDTADNHLFVVQPVTGSMDPNEKEVSPAGDIHEEDSVLTYTIHFQNTGNDTTSFIILKDTLSQYVNPASAVNLASSHAYSSFSVSDYGVLTWVFNPIFLVDSATNEQASKGFVMFSVKKKAGLPLNTQIQNKASIYFDYNEPIVTNTVSSKLTNPDNVWSLTNDANIMVNAAPNPFAQSTLITIEGVTATYSFELYDVNGKLIKSIPALNENRFVLQRGEMSRGIYFYSITTGNKQRAYGRLAVQ